MKRSLLKAKTPMRKVSAKKEARRRSKQGQADLDYLAAVKGLPCVICGAAPPNDAHHVIHDRYGSRKASDRETIPLCKAHHQDGPEAIHANKAAWRERWGPDHGFLDAVKLSLAQGRKKW